MNNIKKRNKRRREIMHPNNFNITIIHAKTRKIFPIEVYLFWLVLESKLLVIN